MPPADPYAPMLGKVVVLDTRSPWLYIGRLAKAGDAFLELEEADAHDGSDGHSTKEMYVLEARKFGVRKNRERIFVRLSEVIAISRLEEVTEY